MIGAKSGTCSSQDRSSFWQCCLFPQWCNPREDDGNADETEQWRNAVKLVPPPKRVDGSEGRPAPQDDRVGLGFMSVKEVETRMIRDGFRWYVTRSPDCDEKRILYYLYGREFAWELSRRDRRWRIRRFLANADTIARMNVFLSCVGSSDSTNIPTRANRCLWRKMQETIICYGEFYKNGSVNTIFAENFMFPYIMILQETKACYLAAPAAVISYKLAENKIRERVVSAAEEYSASEAKDIAAVQPVDASRYIRYRFSDDDLERWVVGNEGGSSWLVLQNLLGYGDNKGFRKYSIPAVDSSEREEYMIPAKDRGRRETISRLVFEALDKYGPALLPCFDMSSILSLRLRQPEPADATAVVYMPSFDVVRGDGGDEVDALSYTGLDVLEGKGAATRAMKIAFFEEVNGVREASKENFLTSSADNDLDEPQPQAIRSSSSSTSLVQSVGDDAVDQAAVSPAAHHAMVVIGSRFDGMKYWFLIQNSWRTMPLLEMSDEFLAKYQGDSLVFVTRPVSAADVRTVLSSRSCVFYECAIGDDGGDNMPVSYEEESLLVKRAGCNCVVK